MKLLSIPAQHPYPRALQPARGWPDLSVLADPVVDPAEPGRWWPHPGLEPAWWDDHTADVVHVHFGFEHLGPDRTRDFVAALAHRSVPLVLTVHDLDNPHLSDQTDYHRQLGILITAAARVLTLSACAAEQIHTRYGRTATVVPHPAIVDRPDNVRPARRSERAGVFLKSGRANVVSDPEFYRALDAEVYAHPGAAHLARRADHVHEPMTDTELFAAVASHPVVVLPYTRGTHSGWLRMCRDLGVSVAVPDCGCYASQAPAEPDAVGVYRTGDGADAARAVRHLLRTGPVAPTQAAGAPDLAALHHRIYLDLAGGLPQS